MLVDKNKYVRIRQYILMPEERSQNIPEDTKKVPFKMWIKGKLLHESELFEEASIVTASGRVVKGTLKEIEPRYKHTYGEYVEEIHEMRSIILGELWSEKNEL